MRRFPLLPILLLASFLIVGASALSAQAGTRVKEFPIPTAGSDPVGIAAGPDGNLWFTENAGNKIGALRP